MSDWSQSQSVRDHGKFLGNKRNEYEAGNQRYLPCNDIDFSVGHGQSDGERAQVSNFDCYVRDVFQHIDQVTAINSGIPVFMFGHSMVRKCS